jgi:hypothetical protein
MLSSLVKAGTAMPTKAIRFIKSRLFIVSLDLKDSSRRVGLPAILCHNFWMSLKAKLAVLFCFISGYKGNEYPKEVYCSRRKGPKVDWIDNE